MNTKLSLRQLWTIYKRTSVAQGFANSKRDLALYLMSPSTAVLAACCGCSIT